MKKKYIVFGLMAFYFPLKAQVADSSSFSKKKLNKSEIELTLSYYHQDGNNSAVTGGIGTEKLNVYAPNLNLSHQYKLNKFSAAVGMEVISSASTDKIDFIVSSPSKLDVHYHVDANYQRQLKKTDLTIDAGLGVAFESDYLSVPFSLG